MSQAPAAGFSHSQIVSLVGNTFHSLRSVSLSDTILDFSRRFDLEPHVLYTPYMTQFSSDRRTYERAKNYSCISKLWNGLDCVLTSAEAFTAAEDILQMDSLEKKLQYLMEHLEQSAGCFCGRQINIAGAPLENDYNHCVIGIRQDALKHVPAVFFIAADPGHVTAVISALNSGLIHHLIIDETSARQILELSMEYYPFREFLTARATCF